jgi:hypothetical protein
VFAQFCSEARTLATYRHKGSLTYFVKEHFPCSKVWKLEMKTLSLSLFLFLSIKGIQWASINYLGLVIKTYPIQIKFNMNYRFILIINKTLKGLDIYLTHTHVTLLIRIIWILFYVFFIIYFFWILSFINLILFFVFSYFFSSFIVQY